MFSSIFVKIYLQMALLFGAMLVILVAIIGYLIEDQGTKEFQQSANAEAESIIFRLKGINPEKWPQVINDYRMVLPLEITGIEKTLSDNWEPIKELPELYFNDQSDEWKIARRIPDSAQYLLLAELQEPIKFIDVLEIFLAIILPFIIFALGFYQLARKVEQPVNDIMSGTVALATGEFSTRLSDDKFDEPFRTLSQRFNSMAEKVEQLINDQKIMVGAVPHELKTPLSRIRFALDLTQSIDSPSELKSQIEKVDLYVDMLESIIKDTLIFNRMQLDDDIKSYAFILRNLISEVKYELFNESKIELSVVFDDSLDNTAYGNESLLKRAIVNLLENAKSYAKSHIQINVFRTEENNLIIAIHDDGPGITPNEQHLLFIPFSRIDKSRSRDTGGIGLGLALVDLIMRKHRGRVSYQDSKLGGAAFSIEWPAFSE